MKIRFKIIVLLFTLSTLGLSACQDNPDDNAPLVIVATSAAPDAGFYTYRHESGVFSIRIPPNWVADNLPDPNGVRVQFSNLEGTESVVRLTVYVVNTGTPMTREGFLNAAAAYQPPEDVANYGWQLIEDPIDQSDGSRRLVGVRTYPTIGPRAMNIFLQGNGSYFSALEADVTDADDPLINILAAVVNTYRVNSSVALQIGEVTGVTSFTGVIGFDSYTAWSDSDGGFNITGRVVNNADYSVEAVRLTGYLFDSRSNRLSEKSSILTTDILAPGEGAPFRLRFDGGRPSTVVRYELHAAARASEDTVLRNFYGKNNFTVQSNDPFYNESGFLVVSGQLSNNGSRLVKLIKVVVSIFDDQNNIVATETVFIDKDQLLPGEAGSYEVVMYDVGGPAIRYELNVMGTAE
ncbi:MAG: hypothetical protein DPW16_20630 [Chloroflexi bacterium]|nr:hypothetical protein [Chloroflexota bacterium]